MFEENIKYYQESEIPVRIVKNTKRISNKTQINLGSLKQFLKKASKFVLVLSIISTPVYLLSAFEAHVVNVTARICGYSETRTMGFWKNHSCIYDPDLLPQELGNETINTFGEVDKVFEDADASEMRDMLEGQLLAMKFNIDYLGIGGYLVENEGTLDDIVAGADYLLRQDPEPPIEVLEETKNLLDDLNNDLHQIRYCSPSFFSCNNLNSLSEEPVITEEPTSGDFNPELFAAQINPDNSEESTTTEATTTEATTTEETTTEEPPLPEPTVAEPPTEEPPTEEPPAEEPPSEEPPVEEPPAEEPPADEPPAEEPPPEEPPAEEPPAEEPPAEEPPTEESPAPEPEPTPELEPEPEPEPTPEPEPEPTPEPEPPPPPEESPAE